MVDIEFVGSPNFNKRPVPITLIVIHATASNNFQGVINWFNNSDSKVSAHYTIGKDGLIVQHVQDKDRAWHAGESIWKGRPDCNDYSIGIELVNLNDGKDPYPEAQHQALVELCRYLSAKYDIGDIAGHSEVSPGRKTDPAGYDLDRLWNEVFFRGYKPGVWVANGHPGDTIDLMYSWQPSALTCIFDHLQANRVREYKQTHPETSVIIRFMHPQNWQDSPVISARNFGQEIAGKWPDIRDLNPYVYFGNEMNLHYENGDQNPGNQHLYESREFYEKYAAWIRLTAKVIKDKAPEMRLVTPPFAFGHGEDGIYDNQGRLVSDWMGYDFLAETIRDYFDNILTFHAYWGDGRGAILDRLYKPDVAYWYAFRWRRLLDIFKDRYSLDARMIIDEAGNFNAGHPEFFEQVKYFSRECLMDSRVLAVTFFLWLDPTKSPGNIPNSWVQKMSQTGLRKFVEQLKELTNGSGSVTEKRTMFNHKAYIESFLQAGKRLMPDPKYKVKLKEAEVETGEKYWRVIGVHHLAPDENQGGHNIYLEALDEAGQRIRNPFPEVQWTWEGRRPEERISPVVLDKSDSEPGGNIAVHGGQVVSVWMDGKSDIVSNLHTNHPDERGPNGELWNSIGHHSFYVVFQRTKGAGGSGGGDEPEPGEKDRLPGFLAELKKLIGKYE